MSAEEKGTTGEASTKPVFLVSQEGDKFEVETRVAIMSELVKTMISDDAGDDEGMRARKLVCADARKLVCADVTSARCRLTRFSCRADAQEIPLIAVKSRVLAKVIEFCKHHVDAPMPTIEKVRASASRERASLTSVPLPVQPLKSSNLHDVVDEWDAQFVDVEQEVLFEMILAANYMDIKSLLDLACAKVATMIKEKTPEEIRHTFNIVNDFTPEEEAQVREENRWIEE